VLITIGRLVKEKNHALLLRAATRSCAYRPGVLQSAYDRFIALSSRRTTSRVMADLRPDCILSYWAHPDGAVAARFARAARIPSGVIVGGSDVLILARDVGRRRRSVVRALQANDAVITVGRQLADAVEALGVPTSKVHVVYQGVDDALFSPGAATDARRRLAITETGKVLVSIGSLIPVKGIDVGPGEPGYWTMQVSPATRTCPIGRVYRFVALGPDGGRDLVSYYLNVEARVRQPGRA
jgi:glycosyl transferase family 4